MCQPDIAPIGRPSFTGNRSLLIRWLALTGLLLAASPALAETPPAAAEPGRIEEQLRPLPQPDSSPPVERPATPAAQPLPLDEETRFVLRGVQLQGNETFSDEDLQSLWQEDLDQEVSLPQIEDIVRRITAFYRNSGYILSKALLPPQEILDGQVTIEVVEGYVARIQAEQEQVLEGAVAGYADHIGEERPLRVEDLERWLLLMNDLSGVHAQSVLDANPDQTGAADLTLKIQRGDPSGQISLDNRAGPYYQDWALRLGGSADNLLGLDEGLALRLALAGDAASGGDGGYRNLNLSLNLPIGSQGWMFDLATNYTRSVPGHDLEDAGYLGESSGVRLGLRYPLLRSRSRSLHARIGFDLDNNQLDLLGQPVQDDQLRVLRAGLSLDWASLGGRTLLGLEGSAGLDLFDASQAGDADLSRADGDGEFFALGFDLVHLRELWPGIRLRADLVGQISDRKLLSAEELAFGGARIGRAYDSSEITGDRGIGMALEITHGLPYNLEGYGFYDIARVANHTGEHASMASTGAGLRYRPNLDLSAQLELALPLTREVNSADPGEGDDWRLFLSVSYNL